MNLNFYHWHSRVELKPDPSILEKRWDAAAAFAENADSATIDELLKLVLFSATANEFTGEFSRAILEADPTFPSTNNLELVRVMATAAADSIMETPSDSANAVSLGLIAAGFPSDRVDPVCRDILDRAAAYLNDEAEKKRRAIDATAIVRAEKQLESQLNTLKSEADQDTINKAYVGVGRVILNGVKDSHLVLQREIRRLAEESQFLWWIVGKRSPSMDRMRSTIDAKEYVFPVASEAAQRVDLLPAAASSESLIDEALSQCIQPEDQNFTLLEFVASVPVTWSPKGASVNTSAVLTPISSVLGANLTETKARADFFKKLGLSMKTKFPIQSVARQYFHENMFIRAMEAIS